MRCQSKCTVLCLLLDLEDAPGEVGIGALPAAGDNSTLEGWKLRLFVSGVEISCLS